MPKTNEEDQLRRCLHLTMRSYVDGKLDESKPCLHWECIERNKAADRIEELAEAAKNNRSGIEALRQVLGTKQARIAELEAALAEAKERHDETQ